MPRFAAALVVALAVAGCSRADPSSSLLTPGQVVVVASDDAHLIDAGDLIYPKVGAGVRLMVGVDPGDWNERPEDFERRAAEAGAVRGAEIRRRGPIHAKAGENSSEIRVIRVTVQDGPMAGLSAGIYRKDVRPIP